MKKVAVIFLVFLIVMSSGSTFANNLSVSALSAVLIDGDTGRVLFAKNQDKRLSMASTTKIMTALLLCENKELSDTVVINDEILKTEGSSLGLKKGMTVSCEVLLYGMMLSSGNDAANAAAVAVSGNIPDFVELMNKRAAEMGLVNTHFDTPSGLDGETHYTTALELAKLTQYALLNKTFAEACSKKSVNIELDGVKYTLTNHNRLLSMVDGVVGVKTGFTKKSGRCLVGAARRNGVYMISVTLNAPNDWQDHKSMLEYGFSVVKPKTYSFDEEVFNVEVISGEENVVTVKSDPLVFSVGENTKIEKTVYCPRFVYAPVEAGKEIGYIEYKNGENLVARSSLVSTVGIKSVQTADFYDFWRINLKIILGEIL